VNAIELLLLTTFAAGALFVLAELPWLRQSSLADRLRPYTRHAVDDVGRATRRAGTLRQVLAPIVADAGERLGRLVGVDTDLQTRLRRAGRVDDDVVAFRMRQLTFGFGGLALGAIVSLRVGPPAWSVLLMVLGAGLLGALVPEQLLANEVAARQRRRRAELPVVVEQLGLLLAAGYSLTAALGRLATRGSGVVADDLATVTLRVRQGASETVALQQWAALCDLDAVRRLVAVLALHTEAGDLGSLIAEEARAERAEAHRDLLEAIERRSQLVWVPVTVATLVPGLIFLAVPFYSAMSQVTGGG